MRQKATNYLDWSFSTTFRTQRDLLARRLSNLGSMQTVNVSHTIVFTGGGTAGHVLPTKPVIERCKLRGDRVVFIGSKSGLERQLVEDWDVEFSEITAGKLRRYLSFENVIDAFRVPIGILQALFLLLKLKPDAVFSKGGYVAFPVVVAAWLLRIPVVAHESDLSPGLATRLCTPFVRTQCVSFAQTKTKAKRVVETGTPIRAELLVGDAKRAKTWLNLRSQSKVLVVVGGSLGAEAINHVVHSSIKELAQEFVVIHVCGKGNIEESLRTVENYFQFEYINEQWGDILALADVVISRSGANALFELLSLRKPNLLIPLPLSKSRGDQIENAELAETNGWSVVLPESECTNESLIKKISLIAENVTQWQAKLQTFEFKDSAGLILAELDLVL